MIPDLSEIVKKGKIGKLHGYIVGGKLYRLSRFFYYRVHESQTRFGKEYAIIINFFGKWKEFS